jgi:hypothetical protein
MEAKNGNRELSWRGVHMRRIVPTLIFFVLIAVPATVSASPCEDRCDDKHDTAIDQCDEQEDVCEDQCEQTEDNCEDAAREEYRDCKRGCDSADCRSQCRDQRRAADDQCADQADLCEDQCDDKQDLCEDQADERLDDCEDACE